MSQFTRHFSRLRRSQRLGRLTAALLAGAAATAAVWLLLGLADAALAFPVSARVGLTIAAAAIAGLGTLWLLGRAVVLPAAESAVQLDALTNSQRCPVSAALGLHSTAAGSAETPLSAWLRARALEEAAEAIAPVPSGRVWPGRALRAGVAAGGILALIFGSLWLMNREAFAAVAQRLLHPSADLPPWSRLKFTLGPAAPSAVYGGEALITAECSEAPEEAVECLVRMARTGTVLRLPAARESQTRFSRRLESLTEPVEVAFAAGRARSAWVPLEILYQPRILSGTLHAEPPEWLRQPSVTLPLDAPEATVSEGARLTLTLQSNRPLGGGTLTLAPAGNADATAPAPAPVEAVLAANGDAVFSWTAAVSGTLSVVLRDVRGTPSEQPLTLPLTVRPDQAPAVELTSPPPLLLATPGTKVPLAGTAEDDHGLSRMRVVKTLAGFRDRPQVIAPELREKRYEFEDVLPLAPLGLEPGQTIEVFLEASDHNPSLLGQASSAVSRVHIISEEDYAERLRAQTTLKQFAARYQAAQKAMQEAREALKKLDEALQKGDAAATEAARQAAEEANRNAADLMEKLAEDFPAFEMEKRLKDLAKQAAAPLRENQSGLGSLPADPQAARAAVEEMMKRLAQPGAEMDALKEQAEKVAELGRLMEMAAKFREIYKTQESIVRRTGTIVEEMRKGNDQNRRLLPSLADTQEKNRKELEEFAKELEKRAEALPPDEMYDAMHESAMNFLNELETSQPGSAMDAAAKAGRDADAHAMLQNAELARSILERLMQKNEPFPQACQGQCQKFNVPHPDMNDTMAQLLAGMCNRPGSQPNPGTGGGGMGMGGTGPDGAAQPGYGMMDLPVMGPQRMSFDAPSMGGKGGGKDGKTGAGRQLPVAAERGTLKPGDLRHGDSSAPSVDPVPELYRDAVKRYFTPPAN